VTTAPRSLLTDKECRPPRRARGSYGARYGGLTPHGSDKYRPAGSKVFDIVAGSRGKPPLKRPKTGRLNGAPNLKILGQWEGLPGPLAGAKISRASGLDSFASKFTSGIKEEPHPGKTSPDGAFSGV